MSPVSSDPTKPFKLYLVAIVIAVVALALGVWDVAVERDGGGNWLVQLAMPLLLILLVGGLYMRARAERTEVERDAAERDEAERSDRSDA